MSSFFITLLNMTLTASYVALIVIVMRFVLGKLRVPKVFSYVLWAVVLFRLVFPFSLESVFSIIPGKPNAIPQNIVYAESPAINTGITFVDRTVNNSIQTTVPPVSFENSINPMQVVLEVGTLIWLLGMVLLIGYALFSYVRLKHRLTYATRLKGNIYETDQIKTPFVLGFIKPRIYLPTSLSEQDADYILKHELTHIKRFDHLIKPLAFLVLVLHWFNPLMWLSYFLMIKDMEMSCDERVLKETHNDARAEYSSTLLTLASKQSGLLGPLSFGESNVKSRVRNILNYKRPAFWVGIVVIFVVAALSLSMLMNPISDRINYITEIEAKKIAQKFVQDREATWHAEFKKDDVIQINNSDGKYTVWVVEALFPGGSKEIYKIDAESGGLLVLMEFESPFDTPTDGETYSASLAGYIVLEDSSHELVNTLKLIETWTLEILDKHEQFSTISEKQKEEMINELSEVYTNDAANDMFLDQYRPMDGTYLRVPIDYLSIQHIKDNIKVKKTILSDQILLEVSGTMPEGALITGYYYIEPSTYKVMRVDIDSPY